MPAQIRRSEKLLAKEKIDFMNKKLEHSENVPLRLLSLAECELLVVKVALAIYIVIE